MARDRIPYRTLVQFGFLPFEARELKTITNPSNVPYIRDLISDRLRYFHKCLNKDWSVKKYRSAVKSKYRGKGCMTQSQYDFWKFLRSYEDRYKSSEKPPYDSPWKKKQKDHRRFSKRKIAEQRKQRRTPLEKYDEGRMR